MYNAPQPKLEDLPTNRQLAGMSVVAAIGAVAIGVMVYLPAEYGVDPTGVGAVLGLTEKGRIKQELKEEAERDRLLHQQEQSFHLLDVLEGAFIGTAHAQDAWRDTVTFTLEPGAYTEIKLTMAEGDQAQYAWTAEGGRINYDLHAHADGKSVTYDKGRGKSEGQGEIQAPFAGDHGWFWRNRDDSAVTVTLQLNGAYSEIVRSE